jgi:hypothetical protein
MGGATAQPALARARALPSPASSLLLMNYNNLKVQICQKKIMSKQLSISLTSLLCCFSDSSSLFPFSSLKSKIFELKLKNDYKL